MSLNRDELEPIIETMMADYPICEYAFGDAKAIPTSDRVHTICKTDCPRYGKSWACPPNAGDINENRRRIATYDRFLMYSTVWTVADAWNLSECQGARKEHEKMTIEFRHRLLERLGIPLSAREEEECPEVLFLSVGCSICETCACPKEPCRHPQDRIMTPESHGILVMQLAEDLGLTYQFDGTTVVYFTMILF